MSAHFQYHNVETVSLQMTHLETVTCLFLGAIGGATTFASAKVRNAIGRIGIFFIGFIPGETAKIGGQQLMSSVLQIWSHNRILQ